MLFQTEKLDPTEREKLKLMEKSQKILKVEQISNDENTVSSGLRRTSSDQNIHTSVEPLVVTPMVKTSVGHNSG